MDVLEYLIDEIKRGSFSAALSAWIFILCGIAVSICFYILFFTSWTGFIYLTITLVILFVPALIINLLAKKGN